MSVRIIAKGGEYMITIVARGRAKEGMLEQYKVKAKEMEAATQKEEGCISYKFFQDMEDPYEVAFIEQWEDQQSIDRHNQSEHFVRLVPQLKELRSSSNLNKFKEVED